ncbi:DEAD/DEAH box helicase family protein [Pseudomaricurvus alkylphenolicus]|uniref:DEAD/DEAH box helicase family protein n=1 Tax=Pseudomaricurvus alkylphenolicus TaxID=1306991 RepID=UPI00141E613E|nr:DEAD/DEAH box helicase family protein [Pseudomaricurvus alkylphenolicus]NIB42115.1 DEAD/DEAH box helicase family protein [Pseudomaricurvus alkylphenolicus]
MNELTEQQVTQAYLEVRQKQAMMQNRELTPFADAVAQSIQQAASKAVREAREEKEGVTFNVVSAPTGGGKTTSSVAYALARRKVDPEFTAAFILPTAQLCNEVYESLMDLADGDQCKDIMVWTGAHDAACSEQKRYDRFGLQGVDLYDKEGLLTTPVIVVTHNKWLAEMKDDKDRGVRRCNGNLRQCIFIDENPELVELIERVPSDVAKLRDFVQQVDSEHPWLPLLKIVQERMDSDFESAGAKYSAPELVSLAESEELTVERLKALHADYIGYVNEAMAASHQATLMFLKAASTGYVFLSRQQPKSFVAYLTSFRPAPGYVLLDATADLTGLYQLMSGVDSVDVPKVNYCNLGLRYIEHPARFKQVRDFTKSISKAREYVAWMRDHILTATEEGDEVLVVTHKKIVADFELFRPDDGSRELWWDGRRIHCNHWGCGVGSNDFKHVKHVFLFSEFHRPGRATAGNVLALENRKAVDADFSQLQGGLQGKFLRSAEGHLLRWAKQLACRGNVRNIDADGNCGQMTLHTSMELERLVSNIELLFPGARLIESVRCDSNVGNDVLADLLTSPDTPETLSYSELADQIGVSTKQVSPRLDAKKIRPLVVAFGWRTASAKELGLSGRSKYLTRLQVSEAA